jgi:pimeloyl-ACP methyl ester carboxylesterase
MAEMKVQDISIHVQHLGEGGTPVLFLHGLVMDNLSSWYFTAATKVAGAQEVILYDMRGHGRSERPDSGYQLSEMVQEAFGVLDAVQVQGPVHVVGNSFGGLLALAMAVHSPQRIASLFLVDAHVGAAGWGRKMSESLRKEGDERDALIAEHFQDWLGRHSERKRNRLAKAASALVLDTRLLQDLEESMELGGEDLEGISVPVRGMYGTQSDLARDVEFLSCHLPAFSVRWVEGASHSVLWEDTQGVVEEIMAWVRRNE